MVSVVFVEVYPNSSCTLFGLNTSNSVRVDPVCVYISVMAVILNFENLLRNILNLLSDF